MNWYLVYDIVMPPIILLIMYIYIKKQMKIIKNIRYNALIVNPRTDSM
jgi:hypothetical protein